MSSAKCMHAPRVMVPNGGKKHKDGTPQLQCQQCVRDSHNAHSRRKQDYDVWFQRQGGMCAFCGAPLDHSNRTHLDHNHRTNQKRGLVHAACNQMIGGIENAVALVGIHAVLNYLGLTVDNT
jgi:ribosomal protein L37E